jgi:hypothetical protein
VGGDGTTMGHNLRKLIMLYSIIFKSENSAFRVFSSNVDKIRDMV